MESLGSQEPQPLEVAPLEHSGQSYCWNSMRSNLHPASLSELPRPWPLHLLRLLYLVEIGIVWLGLCSLLGSLLGSISPSATTPALFGFGETRRRQTNTLQNIVRIQFRSSTALLSR